MSSLNLPDVLNNIPSSVGSNAPTEQAFTPRIQILTGLSEVMKAWKKDEQGTKPEEGTFWFGPPGGKCFGRIFYAVPLATRDHALSYAGTSVNIESFNAPQPGSPPKNKDEEAFAKVMALPKQQPKEKTFNIWGGDALLWVPPQLIINNEKNEEKFAGSFGIYFMHSTARPEIANCRANRGKLCYVRSHENHSSQYSWYVPEIGEFVSRSVDPKEFDNVTLMKSSIPTNEQLQIEVSKFLNPVSRTGTSEGVDGRPR